MLTGTNEFRGGASINKAFLAITLYGIRHFIIGAESISWTTTIITRAAAYPI
jgi:hypothetical protein